MLSLGQRQRRRRGGAGAPLGVEIRIEGVDPLSPTRETLSLQIDKAELSAGLERLTARLLRLRNLRKATLIPRGPKRISPQASVGRDATRCPGPICMARKGTISCRRGLTAATPSGR